MQVEESWDRVEDSVSWFRDKMLDKLFVHRDKQYWMDVPEFTMVDARTRLGEELEELDRELFEPRQEPSWENIIAECSDVANFAMMIAEKAKESRDKEIWASRTVTIL
jgi:hypothetical protein